MQKADNLVIIPEEVFTRYEKLEEVNRLRQELATLQQQLLPIRENYDWWYGQQYMVHWDIWSSTLHGYGDKMKALEDRISEVKIKIQYLEMDLNGIEGIK